MGGVARSCSVIAYGVYLSGGPSGLCSRRLWGLVGSMWVSGPPSRYEGFRGPSIDMARLMRHNADLGNHGEPSGSRWVGFASTTPRRRKLLEPGWFASACIASGSFSLRASAGLGLLEPGWFASVAGRQRGHESDIDPPRRCEERAAASFEHVRVCCWVAAVARCARRSSVHVHRPGTGCAGCNRLDVSLGGGGGAEGATSRGRMGVLTNIAGVQPKRGSACPSKMSGQGPTYF